MHHVRCRADQGEGCAGSAWTGDAPGLASAGDRQASESVILGN